MDLNIESLLIALAFVMPGFLTSRLVDARTPTVLKQTSPFIETSESVLRSVYIDLIAGPITLLFFKFFVLDQTDISLITQIGLREYVSRYPYLSISFVLLWLILAFLLAIIFGYYWDPFHFLSERLVEDVGFKTRDPWFELRQYVKEQRIKGQKKYQLWLQVRTKNGCKYQGEFVYIGQREGDLSREILLAHVTFYPSDNDSSSNAYDRYNYVYLDLQNCESIEILMGVFTPQEPTKVNLPSHIEIS